MSRLSTHVLDTARGVPAAGINVTVETLAGELLGAGITDSDGRILELLPPGLSLPAGEYRLRFTLETYFAGHGPEIFYPEATIHVRIDPARAKYHLPLLISNFGYTTYRGS